MTATATATATATGPPTPRKRPRSSMAPASLLLSLLLLIGGCPGSSAQQQDPMTMNGGSVLAMAGRDCVALAVDKRFGSGPQTVGVSPRHVLAPHPGLLVAFTGMEGDVQSLAEELSVQISARIGRGSSGFGFEDEDEEEGGRGGSGSGSGAAGGPDGIVPAKLELRRHASCASRRISPGSMASLTSHVLYGRRRSPYYVNPIMAGLERVAIEEEGDGGVGRDAAPGRAAFRYRPFLCSHDVIGAQSRSDAFVCSGAASKSMYGTAQALWQPGLGPEELVGVCGRAFLSALERDCLSGYGAIVYLIVGSNEDAGGEGCTIYEFDLACRND